MGKQGAIKSECEKIRRKKKRRRKKRKRKNKRKRRSSNEEIWGREGSKVRMERRERHGLKRQSR